jgi:hypothetical protein
VWHGPLRAHGPARSWAVLRALLKRFPSPTSGPSESVAPSAPGYDAAYEHLRRITEPETGGAGPG